jgi:hypothetical protein
MLNFFTEKKNPIYSDLEKSGLGRKVNYNVKPYP